MCVQATITTVCTLQGDDVHAGYTRSWDKMLSKKNAVKYVTVSQVGTA